MKKIISLFQRNYDGDKLVRNEIVPGAEWVIAGEGKPTRKYDGTCCLIKNNKLFKRYDCKKGKTPPDHFLPAQDPDPISGHWPGWVPVGNGNEDVWFIEGLKNIETMEDSTYELVGPKIQKNPEGFDQHRLIKHGCELILENPRTYEDIKIFLEKTNIEGIVWHRFDGQMVKIKKKDFGFKR